MAGQHPTTELLQRQDIVLVVDTNILVEFPGLDKLPWHELAPNVRSIRLIVPTSVAEEMDYHKKKTGRLRRRGLEFNKLMRAIEASLDERTILRSADPTITLEFGDIFRRSELDGDLYDLDDSDGRIVAEFARISSAIPGAILLADDGKPIRLANKTGLAHVRPPAQWRLPDGPDERDALISELRSELGAQPLITVAFPDLQDLDGRPQLSIPSAPGSICDQCAQLIMLAVIRVNPQIGRSYLEMRHPHAMRCALIFGRSSEPVVGRVTAEDLDDYEVEYRRFIGRARAWATTLPQAMASRGFMLSTTIGVGNQGDRTADRIQVEAELSGDFHFEPTDLMDQLFDDQLEAPDQPTDFPAVGVDLDRFAAVPPKRTDQLHPLDEPTTSGLSKRISWRGEELRQGAHHDLPVLIAADRAGANGVLKVTARGADLAKPYIGSIVLRGSNEAFVGSFSDFLSTRLYLVPSKYRRSVAAELAAASHQCTC